jgi:hypothetical protein
MQGAPPVSTTLVADVNDTGGKFAVGVKYTGAKLPPVSTTLGKLVPLIPVANFPLETTTPEANCHRCQQHRRQICHRCWILKLERLCKKDSCSKGNFFHRIDSYTTSPGDSDTGDDRDSQTVEVRGKDSYIGEVIRIKKILIPELCFYWICSYTGDILLPYRGSYFNREILNVPRAQKKKTNALQVPPLR